MRTKSINVLEYNKIIAKLEEQAGSEMAKKIISELTPFHEVPAIRDMLAETTEAVKLIVHKGPLPLGGFYDIEAVSYTHLDRRLWLWKRTPGMGCSIQNPVSGRHRDRRI